jgi:hypothetical protein
MNRNAFITRITLAALLTGAVLAFSGCSKKADSPEWNNKEDPATDDSKTQGGGRPDPNSVRAFKQQHNYRCNESDFSAEPDILLQQRDSTDDLF